MIAMDITSADDFQRQIQTTIDSLTTKIKPAAAGGVNTAPLRKELERARGTREQFSSTVQTELERIAGANSMEKSGIDATAKAAQDKAMADQSRAQEVADNEKYVNDLFGIQKGANTKLAQDAIELDNMRGEARTRLQEIGNRNSVTFFDNPLDWIVNQVEAPALASSYNALADQIDLVSGTIDDRVVKANANANRLNAAVPTITAVQAKATADAVAAEALKFKAKADNELAARNITFGQQKLAADINILEGQGKLTDVEMRNSEMSFRARLEAVRLEESQAQRNVKALEIVDSFQNRMSTQRMLDRYAAITGQLSMDPRQFQQMPPAERERIAGIALSGSFGANPIDALHGFISSNPGPGVSDETRALMQYVNDKISLAKKQENVTKASDEKVKYEETNKNVRTMILSDLANPTQGGAKANPFFEVPITSLVKAGLWPADSPLVAALKPYLERGQAPTTNQVLDSIEAAYPGNPGLQGTIAAQYYKTNIAVRNKSFDLKQIGISEAMPTNYNHTSESFLGFGGTPRDLTKPEEAAKYFLYKQQMKNFKGFNKDRIY